MLSCTNVALAILMVVENASARNATGYTVGGNNEVYATTEAGGRRYDDDELCDCFDIDMVGCGPEATDRDRVCYSYRFNYVAGGGSGRGYCLGRQADFVKLLVSTADMHSCGLRFRDLDDLIVDFAPSGFAMCGNYDVEEREYGIKFDFDDEDESRLFSVCFDAEYVGGTQSDGEILISLDREDREIKCPAPFMIPDICIPNTSTSSTTTTSSSTSPSPITPGSTASAPTTPSPVTASLTTSTPTTPSPTTQSQRLQPPTITAPTAAPTTSSPTTAPSAAPTFVACDTNDALNIAFLLDESGSVDQSEWSVILQFVDRIVTFDVANDSYVSLFEYASLVAYSQFLEWTPIATGYGDVERALEKNPYNTAGKTYTWDAVNRVLDEFYDYRKRCDDGCETRKDMLFLFTDGTPSDEVCPRMIPRVNQSDVDIVIVGIGADAESWMDEVACLDYRDYGEDIFFVTEFDSVSFNAIEGMMRAKTCTGQSPAGIADRGGLPWVYEDGNTTLGPVPTAIEGNAVMDDFSARDVWTGGAIVDCMGTETGSNCIVECVDSELCLGVTVEYTAATKASVTIKCDESETGSHCPSEAPLWSAHTQHASRMLDRNVVPLSLVWMAVAVAVLVVLLTVNVVVMVMTKRDSLDKESGC